MLPTTSINLLDWRINRLQQQTFKFIRFCFWVGVVLLTAITVLNRYQQRLTSQINEQYRQQTALRQTNQQLQQQINQLQQQAVFNDTPQALIEAPALSLFRTLLTRLPMTQGRLTSASLTTDADTYIFALQGYTASADEFNRLKNHIEQLLPQGAIELTQFELQQQHLQFGVHIRLANPLPVDEVAK
ncbi:hypothetical protein A1D23_04015 [Chelonobacter oris]|uniref:Competence protein ComB n=1 Tax=Chelonobacter oris TaxID=505317 RepID=A0A0A3AS26_9PAST|nr:hypothetical protein [Chelonobacter oris]KGQ69905.1 hypothetical protein OA57_09775 [Chelonobacter oris]MDH2999271.1 hypothetical protein [Chelonobacter oris]